MVCQVLFVFTLHKTLTLNVYFFSVHECWTFSNDQPYLGLTKLLDFEFLLIRYVCFELF